MGRQLKAHTPPLLPEGAVNITDPDSRLFSEQTDQIVASGTQVLIPPQSRIRETPRPGWDTGRYAFMLVDGVHLGTLENATDRYLDHSSVRSLAPSEAGVPTFSTDDLLTCELQILDGADRRRHTDTAVIGEQHITAALARTLPVLNGDPERSGP